MSNEELAVLIRTDERDRLPELWQQVERFVAMRARSMAEKSNGRHGVTAEDLYQCGYLALVSAVETFSLDAGCKFITWLDYHLRNEFARWGGWKTDHQKREPLNNAISLNAPLSNDGEDETMLEDIQPDPAAEQPYRDVEREIWRGQLRAALEAALNELPISQGETIRRRYFYGEYQSEIGMVLGVSAQRVQQLEENGIRALRKPPLCERLEGFVEKRTPFYHHVGVEQFHRTQTSAVERVVLIRERLLAMMESENKEKTIWRQKNG